MAAPAVSIIMPVFNTRSVLCETIASIQEQTCPDFEVICIDDGSTDGSTDGSADALNHAAQTDPRFKVYHQTHSGAGAARNLGLSLATGKYVLFIDSDNLLCRDMLRKLVSSAEQNQAEIAACNFSRLTSSGKKIPQTGIYTKWIPADASVFSYRDCPDYILRIASGFVWNKLFLRSFLLDRGLHFDETLTCNDISFVAVSLASADRIHCTTDTLIQNRIHAIPPQKSLRDIHSAVSSTVSQLSALPHAHVLKNALYRFSVETYITALKKYIPNFAASGVGEFYHTVHKLFNDTPYNALEAESLHNNDLFREFCTVQKHDYPTMKQMAKKRIIVSLTTFPARIHLIPQVLDSIFRQTKKADKILLWLAEEQFPQREQELPPQLIQYAREGTLSIRWCDDLKPHKKYFYAFQEYPDDLIITIDDDLLYPSDLIASLYASYLLFPNAVSAGRTNLIVVTEQNEILPYRSWIHETDNCIHQPSMQLMATGVGGILYSPSLFRKEFLDASAIRKTCLWADDLWLKAMELVCDVPVVLARSCESLQFLPSSQNVALHQINVAQGKNDIQLQNIIQWTDQTFYPGILIEKLTQSSIGINLSGTQAALCLTDEERRFAKTRYMRSQSQLRNTQSLLDQTRSQNQQLNFTIAQLQNQLQQTQTKLQQTEANKPVRRQLQALGRTLRQKKKSGMTVSLALQFLLYYLAWIPCFFLCGIIHILMHGFKKTLKQLLRLRA